MKIKLKRINKKRPWEKKESPIVYTKYQVAATTPIVGNWDSMAPVKYVKVSRKWFMTPSQVMKVFRSRKYYNSKITFKKKQNQTKLATYILNEANRIYVENGPQQAKYILEHTFK